MTLTATDIVKQINELPPFPQVTVRLLELLEDEEVGLSDIADVLSRDPAMSVKVIMMANSPFYMVSQPIESIQDALLVLGISTVGSLALSVSIHNCLTTIAPLSDDFDMTAFWKHSYATAIAGSQLSEEAGTRQSNRVYLAGLIHDIGKLVQGYRWPEAWKATIHALKQSESTYANLECNYFSVSHTEISLALCRAWRFAPSIIQMIEQLSYDSCESYRTGGNETICVAHTIAIASGFSFPLEESCDYNVQTEECFRELISSLSANVEHQLSCLYSAKGKRNSFPVKGSCHG